MKRVIICDDEEKICRLIIRLIDWEALGMEVAGTANNGRVALEMIREEQPDVVITDISMPEYDGIELIRLTREFAPELPFIIISGYRQFDYAKSAIKYGVEDYLLKPINQDELTDALKKIQLKQAQVHARMAEMRALRSDLEETSRKRQEEFLHAVLNEEGVPVRTLISRYDMDPEPADYTAVMIKTVFNAEEYSEAGSAALKSKIRDQALKAMRHETVSCFASEEKDGVYLIVFRQLDGAGEGYTILGRLIRSIRYKNEMYPDINTVIGVSRPHRRKTEIPGALEEARIAAYEQLKGKKDAVICFSEEMHTKTDDVRIFDEDLMSRFHSAIEYINREAMDELLDKLFARMEGDNYSGLNAMRACRMIYREFRNGAVSCSYELESGTKEEFESFLYGMNTLPQMQELLRKRIGKDFDHWDRIRNEKKSQPIVALLSYIDSNIGSELSLEFLSREFGFNASYLSALFKKETGKNIKDYIYELRINEAIRELLHTDTPIEQIAANVGYKDEKYFTKQFKKATGLSPLKYRKSYQVR